MKRTLVHELFCVFPQLDVKEQLHKTNRRIKDNKKRFKNFLHYSIDFTFPSEALSAAALQNGYPERMQCTPLLLVIAPRSRFVHSGYLPI
jgi:hypothetical protein